MAEEEDRKRPGVERVYQNDAIAVYWEPQYCIHTGYCLMGAPMVFDAGRRPWVDVDAATADDIGRVVSTCPTGALHFERLDGGPQEDVAEEVTVVPWPNGPLFLRGPIQITDSEGNVIREDYRVALCRCGQSDNKPFCDGSHRVTGFRAD